MNYWVSLAADVALGLVLCSLSALAAAVVRYAVRAHREIRAARRRIHAVRNRVREPLRAPGNRRANSFTTERTQNDG
jgi:hypothetical protein